VPGLEDELVWRWDPRQERREEEKKKNNKRNRDVVLLLGRAKGAYTREPWLAVASMAWPSPTRTRCSIFFFNQSLFSLLF
jgi:hypothetical protein